MILRYAFMRFAAKSSLKVNFHTVFIIKSPP